MYIKLYEEFNNKRNRISNDRLYQDILSVLGYYSTEDQSLIEKANEIYSKYDRSFNNTKIVHTDYYPGVTKPDDSPLLVSHSSNTLFNKFQTPAFFGIEGSYSGDYTYHCVINIENPLDLRSWEFIDEYGKEEGINKWKDLIKEILGEDNYKEREEFINNYGDNYGLFKIIQNDGFDYNWDIVINYAKRNGYDGVIYKESDQSIQYFFTGYIVFDPNQIQILHITEND